MATVLNPPGQSCVLYGVRWETYESLLADFENSSAPRLTYDRGTLEIMSPLPQHERFNQRLGQIVEVVTEEWEIQIDELGSTTFKRQDLEQGFEPDSCYYIENADRIRGKTRIDLTVDPPPDLVIEVDITHPLLNKLPLLAQLGVPEIWQYDGTTVRILVLQGGAYPERADSAALPGLGSAVLSAFMEDSKTLERLDWLRRVRAWARQHRGPSDSS